MDSLLAWIIEFGSRCLLPHAVRRKTKFIELSTWIVLVIQSFQASDTLFLKVVVIVWSCHTYSGIFVKVRREDRDANCNR